MNACITIGRSGQRVSLSATLYSISGAADSGSAGRCLVYVVIKEVCDYLILRSCDYISLSIQ